MGLRRQAPSHGAGQMCPNTDGNAMFCFTILTASSNFPAASNRFMVGMSMCAGHARVQGASQSPTWSESKSSNPVWRASRISSSMVTMFMPSSTGMEHEGSNLPLLVFFTRHIMHEVWFSTSWLWHIVGISKPSLLAASSSVVPGSTSTALLFIDSWIMISYKKLQIHQPIRPYYADYSLQ
jgi:hypothetical protein